MTKKTIESRAAARFCHGAEERHRAPERTWKDRLHSPAFWEGCMLGFASEAFLLRPHEKLQKCDPIADSWFIVGSCLEQAMSAMDHERQAAEPEDGRLEQEPQLNRTPERNDKPTNVRAFESARRRVAAG